MMLLTKLLNMGQIVGTVCGPDAGSWQAVGMLEANGLKTYYLMTKGMALLRKI